MTDKLEFSYSGSNGPDSWGGLCRTGTHQSPIDLPGDLSDVSRQSPQLEYGPVTLTAVNNGHSIQYNVKEAEHEAGNNKIVWNEVPFDLKQFHFHVHSEHTISGHHFPMEMHLVHKSPPPPPESELERDPESIGQARMGRQGIWNRLAVVAFFLDIDDRRPSILWDPDGPLAWFHAVRLEEEQPLGPLDFEMRELLALVQDPHMLHYHGSTTTPPCTEIVDWFIFRRPIGITLDAVRSFPHQENFRPLQGRRDRGVELLAP